MPQPRHIYASSLTRRQRRWRRRGARLGWLAPATVVAVALAAAELVRQV